MAKLKNRQVQIPNGISFKVPETNWVPERYSSFDSVVTQLQAHLSANPHLAQKNSWPTDRPTLEFLVENYNARFCEAMGWTQYLEGGTPEAPPFRPPPPAPILSQLSGGVAAVKKLASGAALLFEWQASGEPPVAAEISAKRAAVCAVCPKNQPTALTQFITGPLAEGFKIRLKALHDMNLTTPDDDKLQGCEACLCPLKLKVHTPAHLVQERTTPQIRSELAPGCWILSEAT